MCRACATCDEAKLVCPDRVSDYLATLHLFAGLESAQLERLAESTTTRELEDGEWLFRRGDAAREFFVLRSGRIALFRLSADGRESIVAVVGVDEILGEERITSDDADRDLYARAVGPCTVLQVARGEFRALLPESPDLSHRLVETLHERQQMLLDHIERLTLQNASGRLVDYLLGQVGEAEGRQRIELSMPKHALAAHLAIQPETLSRAMGRLKSCGHVSEENGSLLIDADALRSGDDCDQCRQIFWGCPGPVVAAAASA